MAELWQFVSRSDMTRDNMSQALEACRLALDQCIPLPRFTSSVHWSQIPLPNRCSIDITSNRDLGSVVCGEYFHSADTRTHLIPDPSPQLQSDQYKLCWTH